MYISCNIYQVTHVVFIWLGYPCSDCSCFLFNSNRCFVFYNDKKSKTC